MAVGAGYLAERTLRAALATKRCRALAAGAAGGSALASAHAAVAPTTTVVVKHSGFIEIIGASDPVVKGVMLLLLLMSIATWAVWLSKSAQLQKARRALKQDLGLLWGVIDFRQVDGVTYSVLQAMNDVTKAELARAGARPTEHMIEGMEERVTALLSIIEQETMYRMLRGTSLLASVGSTAAFVGLAGTVWGIMNSFLGIAASNSTSLAVVAPGIAEALLATAIGLAAAIPAVLLYNNLVRSLAGYRQQLNSAENLMICAVSREARRRADGEEIPVSTPPVRVVGS